MHIQQELGLILISVYLRIPTTQHLKHIFSYFLEVIFYGISNFIVFIHQ